MPSPGQWRGGWSGFPVVKDEDINDAALWYQIDHALNEKNWALGARYWPRVNIQWGGGGPGQQVFQDHLFDSSRTPVMGPDPNDPTKTINLNPNSWEVNYFAGAASHKDADYPGTFDLILGADAYDKRYLIRHIRIASNTADTLFFGYGNFTSEELALFNSGRYEIIKSFGLWWEQRRLHWGHSPSYGSGNYYLLVPPPNVTAESNGVTGSTTYDYMVTSTVEGCESLASDTATTTEGNATLDNDNYNSISWEAKEAADRYNIYRKISGTFKLIGNTDGLSFDDKGSPGTAGYTSPATATIRDKNPSKRLWKHNEFFGLRIAYQSNPYPPVTYSTVLSNGATTLTFAPTQTPNEQGRYEILVAGGWTDFTEADPTFEWYRGAKDEYWSHNPDDFFIGTGKPAASIIIPGPDGEPQSVAAFDRDVWTQTDEGARSDECFTPDLWKTVRGKQLAIEGILSSFYPLNDIEGDGWNGKKVIKRPFDFPTFMYVAGINAFKLGVNNYSQSNGSTKIDLTGINVPYVGAVLYYTIMDWKKSILESSTLTCPDLKSTQTIDTGVSLLNFNDGLTVYATWGWTRQLERTFRHFYAHSYILPDTDTDDFGNVIILPLSPDHPGTLITDPASTTYVTQGDMGFIGDGPEAFIDGEYARYVGDNFNDPTTTNIYPSDFDPLDAFRDRGNEIITAGQRANGYPPTTFIATDGSSSTFVTSGLQDAYTRDRWVARIGTITQTSTGFQQVVSITANNDTTLTFTVLSSPPSGSFSVVAGDVMTIKEPLQGTVWKRVSGEWQVPTHTGGAVEQYKGINTIWQREVQPTIVTRYGKFMTGDIVGKHLLNELYTALNIMVMTGQGNAWVGTGPDGSKPDTYNHGGGNSIFGNDFGAYKALAIEQFNSGAGKAKGDFAPSTTFMAQNPPGDGSEEYSLTATKAWAKINKPHLMQCATDFYVFGEVPDLYTPSDSSLFKLDGDPFDVSENENIDDLPHLGDPDWSNGSDFTGVFHDPSAMTDYTTSIGFSYDASSGVFVGTAETDEPQEGASAGKHIDRIKFDANGQTVSYRVWEKWNGIGPDMLPTVWSDAMLGDIDNVDQKDPDITDVGLWEWFQDSLSINEVVSIPLASIELTYTVDQFAFMRWNVAGGMKYLP
jgi:hypothetical protein